MGMFDTVVGADGRAWQTKALGKSLAVFRIGDPVEVAAAAMNGDDSDDEMTGLLDPRIGPRAQNCQVGGLVYEGDDIPELDEIAYYDALLTARKRRDAGLPHQIPTPPPSHYLTIRDGRITEVTQERHPSLPLFSGGGWEVTSLNAFGRTDDDGQPLNATWRACYDLLDHASDAHNDILHALGAHMPERAADFNDAIVALTPALIAFGVLLYPVEDAAHRRDRFAAWEPVREARIAQARADGDPNFGDDVEDETENYHVEFGPYVGETDPDSNVTPLRRPTGRANRPARRTRFHREAQAAQSEQRAEGNADGPARGSLILRNLQLARWRDEWMKDTYAPLRRSVLAPVPGVTDDPGNTDWPGIWRAVEAAHTNVRTQPGQWHTSIDGALDTVRVLGMSIYPAIETLAELRDLADPYLAQHFTVGSDGAAATLRADLAKVRELLAGR